MYSNTSNLIKDIKNQLFELENHSSVLKKKLFDLEKQIECHDAPMTGGSELYQARIKFSQCDF